MRNLAVTEGAALYSEDDTAAALELQELLNELGCQVGKPDGVIGKRTREAALTCRKFEGKPVPEELNLATLGTFLALYREK